jgi:hypothetical protein
MPQVELNEMQKLISRIAAFVVISIIFSHVYLCLFKKLNASQKQQQKEVHYQLKATD